MTKTLLRPREAQEVLRISRASFYRMCNDGRLPSVRVGKQIRVPSAVVERLIGKALLSDGMTSMEEAR